MSPKVVAVVPCRANSQRLEGKNTRDFCGKPLFCWSVDIAHECNIIDEIIISTNDPEVMKIYGERYSTYLKIKIHIRPEEFAKDDSSMESVIHDLVSSGKLNENAIIMLLQPTSPLRDVQDLLNVYSIFKRNSGFPIISVFREDGLHFKLNGSIYMIHYPRLKDSISGGKYVSLYVMPREKSWDIDTEVDFHRCEVQMKLRIKKNDFFYDNIRNEAE